MGLCDHLKPVPGKTKELVKKKPWVPALIGFAVVSFVFFVVPLITPPAEPPKEASVIAPLFDGLASRDSMLAVPKGDNTGIENVYIAKYGMYDPNGNLADFPENWDAALTSQGATIPVTAYQKFDIVVAVRARAPENIAYVNIENLRVWLGVGGAFDIGYDFAPDDLEYVFESEGYGTSSGYLRANVVWDNGGEGYALGKGETISIDNLVLDLVRTGV